MFNTHRHTSLCTLLFLVLVNNVLSQSVSSNLQDPISFTYNLSISSATSAGVYKPDSTLARTLWSNERKNAGTHTVFWDGKDDAGNLMPDGNYHIQVLSNNVISTWEGVIGNTSDSSSGPTVHHHPIEGFVDMRINNGRAVYITEYNEGHSSEFSFNTSNPQIKTHDVWPDYQEKQSTLITAHMCTDGSKIYFGGVFTPNFNAPTSFVYARNVSDLSVFNFSNGVNLYTTYPSAIDVVDGSLYHRVTGMTVQKTGNYLFVARRDFNSVHVLNKTTGALVQTLTVTDPGYMDTDLQNNLWIITNNQLKKYTVNSNGTITELFTVSGTDTPLNVQVTPDGSKVYVTEGGNTHQVKIYNNGTGALIRTFGQLGGYANSPDVKDDKFMFFTTKDLDYSPRLQKSFICFDASNGSWWLGDPGNNRALHFSATNVLMETFMNIGYNYSNSVDYNNPARVFSNYLEFEIDYSKPLSPKNNSWKLVKNWGQSASQVSDNQYKRLYACATLSNGRTYALNLRKNNTFDVVELASTGLRYTGQNFGQQYALQKDGSLWQFNKGGSSAGDPSFWKRQPLSGFNGAGNPQWGAPVTMATITNGQSDPLNDGASFKHAQITATGLITYFDDERSGGFHLGAIKPGTDKWLWRTSPSTHSGDDAVYYIGEYPKDGTFDIANAVNFAGGGMSAIERSIIYSYKGEFWKATQANYFNHYYDNGLMIGQFGTDGTNVHEEAAPEMAGNSTSIPIVKVGSNYYLYHNDESFHGGVHRWKISGLNTIAVQTIPIVKLGTPAAVALDYIDLMAGLPFNEVLTANAGRWSAASYNAYEGHFTTTNKTTYKKTDRDIRFRSGGDNRSLSCDLGTNTLESWKITGQIAYPEASEPGNNFIEVLDANNRVIVRVSRPGSYPNVTIKANNTTIIQEHQVILYRTLGKLQPLSIVSNGTTVTVSLANYAPVTVTVLNPLANIRKPATLKFTHNSIPAAHQTDIARFRFYKNIDSNYIHYRSTTGGLWKNITSWQSSADSLNWIAASSIPDSNSNTITIRNGHTITVTDSANVDQFLIQNGGSLKVAPTASLIVNNGAGNDIVIADSGCMIIQSDSTGAGRIGKSTGTITGNVTVERYIKSANRKSFRMLSPSVNTVNSTKPFIRDNWQEGQNNTSTVINNTTQTSYGIHITGSVTGANGFDATLTASPSLLYYNQTSPVQAWQPAANTNACNFEVKKGYLVYVRGDRTTDLHSNNSSSNTTLRTTGSVVTGSQTFTSQEGNGRNSLVTNPYPSPIDWNLIYKDSTTSNAAGFENYYTYWDPNVGRNGGFVTVNAEGTKSAATNATTEIQSGQAFFVKAKRGVTLPSFVVKEDHKSTTGNSNVFRAGPREEFLATLYFSDPDSTRIMADAVNVIFDNDFSAAVDNNDAEEMANWEENIAIARAGKMLSIEGRPLIDNNDTLPLRIERLNIKSYEWQFDPTAFAHPNLMAFLEDQYLDNTTLISLTGTTIIPFSVNSDTASAAANRFRVVFIPSVILPVSMQSLTAYQKENGIRVDWKVSNQNNVDRYEIEKSSDGRQFIKAGAVLPLTAGSLSDSYTWFDQYPKNGNNYYRIKTIDKNGSVSYSRILNVKTGGTRESFEIYPNPIVGNNVTIQFANINKGVYTVNLFNVMGQKVLSKMINHSGGSASQTININENLPSGNYSLQTTGNGIIVNKRMIK